jgi:hypothetical protein
MSDLQIYYKFHRLLSPDVAWLQKAGSNKAQTHGTDR